MRREMLCLTVLTLCLSACNKTDGGSGFGTSATSGASFADYDAGAVPGGPGAKKAYALGHAVVDSQLATMNLDVGSDGTELPIGSGTVAQGAALYATQCAQCHGKKGEGMVPAYPQLIGRDPKAEKFPFANDPKLPHTIGNYWPYATTLFDYIRRAMPHVAPGSLTDDQVYALSAYLLAENDVIADTATLDAASLRQVRMPYRDRFVPDDRKPGSRAK
ncbi:MAG: c-type cytochrome [Gemmatimonadaceae bacterium]|nr:c-type cytochrome [Gemmatimonadaceae bacterium]